MTEVSDTEERNDMGGEVQEDIGQLCIELLVKTKALEDVEIGIAILKIKLGFLKVQYKIMKRIIEGAGKTEVCKEGINNLNRDKRCVRQRGKTELARLMDCKRVLEVRISEIKSRIKELSRKSGETLH